MRIPDSTDTLVQRTHKWPRETNRRKSKTKYKSTSQKVSGLEAKWDRDGNRESLIEGSRCRGDRVFFPSRRSQWLSVYVSPQWIGSQRSFSKSLCLHSAVQYWAGRVCGREMCPHLWPKKQHLSNAETLTCPQGSQRHHPSTTPPSTSFTPHGYGAPVLRSEFNQKDKFNFFLFYEGKSKLPTSSIWPVKLATQAFLLMTLLINFQLWCFTIWISQLTSKSASQISNFTAMQHFLQVFFFFYQILHSIISASTASICKVVAQLIFQEEFCTQLKLEYF